jgi:integrase
MARPASGQVVEKTTKRGRVFALRFRAYGERRYVTLGTTAEGWDTRRAEVELANVLADVRRGTWRAPEPEPTHVVPDEEPTFHEYASEWVERRRHEVKERTVESWTNSLSCHLLPFLGSLRLSAITVDHVERFKLAKLREREQWDRLTPEQRKERQLPRPLSNSSINRALKALAQILDSAIDQELLERNVARGKKRRLKAQRPRRTWLEIEEVRAMLDAAKKHRALLATQILAGLRVGELTALRWRDIDLTRGKLRVADSKTDAGHRDVDITPDLLGLLKVHRADATFPAPHDLVFPTATGKPRDRSNILRDIVRPAVVVANARLAEEGLPLIDTGVTNHTMRRTFASLLYEAGASPSEVMSQMGHTRADLALEIYAKKMNRDRETGARMDALVRGDWAPTGTSVQVPDDLSSLLETQNPA